MEQQEQSQHQDQWCVSSQMESLTTLIPQTTPTCMDLMQQINQDSISVNLIPSPKRCVSQTVGQTSLQEGSPLTAQANRINVSEMTQQESPSELERLQFPRRKRSVKLPRSEIQQWQNIIAGYRLRIGDTILQGLSRNYPES